MASVNSSAVLEWIRKIQGEVTGIGRYVAEIAEKEVIAYVPRKPN
ncbi:hypothetical protein [Alicyclobacillus shizuokensis]|nr:hypothetical protein [Alicyclobacillus shizuokensis]